MSRTNQKPLAPTTKSAAVKNKPTGAKKSQSAPPASVSKQQVVIDLLKRQQGASLEELMKVTGWQRHSVQGMLSGVIRKRLGLPLDSNKESRGRVYRIAK